MTYPQRMLVTHGFLAVQVSLKWGTKALGVCAYFSMGATDICHHPICDASRP